MTAQLVRIQPVRIANRIDQRIAQIETLDTLHDFVGDAVGSPHQGGDLAAARFVVFRHLQVVGRGLQLRIEIEQARLRVGRRTHRRAGLSEAAAGQAGSRRTAGFPRTSAAAEKEAAIERIRGAIGHARRHARLAGLAPDVIRQRLREDQQPRFRAARQASRRTQVVGDNVHCDAAVLLQPRQCCLRRVDLARRCEQDVDTFGDEQAKHERDHQFDQREANRATTGAEIGSIASRKRADHG